MLDLRRVAVEARGAHYLQSFDRKLRTQLSDNGSFSLAVGAPVCPEKQQHGRATPLIRSRRRCSQELIGLEGRGSFPLQGEQVQILLQEDADRGGPISP